MATLVRWGGSHARTGLCHHFPDIREIYRENSPFPGFVEDCGRALARRFKELWPNSLSTRTGKFEVANRDFLPLYQGIQFAWGVLTQAAHPNKNSPTPWQDYSGDQGRLLVLNFCVTARSPPLWEKLLVMAIYRLLQNSAFQPEQLKAMITAFEDVCHKLGLAHRDDALRELVAKAIIECGQRGDFDLDQLRKCAHAAIEKPY